MKIISWNIKGISDPKKAKAINRWLFNFHQNVDVVCLQETKASGDTAKSRLHSAHPKLIWFCTANPQGTGGSAIGINPKLQLKEILTSQLPTPNWIGVRLGGPNPFTIISVYAGGAVQVRTEMWKELSLITGPIILTGDFNMVESLDDRWEGKGQCIRGAELEEWEKLKEAHDLTDIGFPGDFTWQNYSLPPLARKARLDRTYITQSMANVFIRAEASPNYNSCISDHYPLVTKLDDNSNKVRANWFHTDVSLFQLPCVKEGIVKIWDQEPQDTPAAHWSKSVKLTQEFLISMKKEVTSIRKRRSEEMYAKLSTLERKKDNISSQEAKEIIEIRSGLRAAEEIQAKDLQVFLKGWWKEREDRPVKEIFKTLKRKQDYEHLPMLEDHNGDTASSEEENQRIIQDHFSRLFSSPPAPTEDKKAALLEVERCRAPVVSELLASQLEEHISPKEVEEAIDSMKKGKSPGLDGLPSEFFQTFKDHIVKPLLKVWEEAVMYKALPFSLNTGVIKLIHKKGTKQQLSNWRPITMLNTAYKIFAKVLARRLGSHLNQWIKKEQKGFVQGRYILDAIISLWEGMEFAKETKQDFCFFKIDFDKAYDRLEWGLSCHPSEAWD